MGVIEGYDPTTHAPVQLETGATQTDTNGQTYAQLSIAIGSIALPTNAAKETGGNLDAINTATAASKTDLDTVVTDLAELLLDTDNLASILTQVTNHTVTANAGTNLNTSLLALETGGNLASLVTNTADLLADGDHLATIDTSTSNTATVAGATTDAAVTSDANGTLSAKLRGLVKILADVWDSTNHRLHIDINNITASLSQANRVPTSNAAQQGPLTLTVTSNSGTFTNNLDNTITFSGNATVARKIRIQNESAGTIYWATDATGTNGSASLAAPASNAVSVEWVEVACTTLHIFVPTGGTTSLNATGGVKVSAWA